MEAEEVVMATMNVSVPDPMRDWVQSQIEGGKYASVSDYVRDLIRRDQETSEGQTRWLAGLGRWRRGHGGRAQPGRRRRGFHVRLDGRRRVPRMDGRPYAAGRRSAGGRLGTNAYPR